LNQKRITVGVLLLVVVGVVVMLFLEAASGPTFRAEDYDTYAECMAGIPREWLPNSLERQGAETACMFVHGQRQGR
jgi:hypothetical protein